MLAPKPTSFLSRITLSPPPPTLLADKCNTIHQLKQVHAQMILTSLIHDPYASSRLLSFYALSPSGDLNSAIKLFTHTPLPNTFMWNTMIRAHASSGYPAKALFLYIDMRRVGVMPGKHTFPFVLKACSYLKSLIWCQMVHTHVMKSGLGLDLYVVNGLVRGYSVSGGLCDAQKAFDEMPERSLSIWTSMVCGYAQNDRANEALLIFDRMVCDGFEPNGATMASVLSACANKGCLELGERIHEFMKKKGVEFGVILGTALVNMYAKNGEISKARRLFDRMQEKNAATWNAMIHGLAVHGHGEEALSLFRRLEKEGVEPNGITFVGVLSACCHAGFLDEGKEIFHSMKIKYKLEPQIEHYGCMVDLLGRGGRLEEAEEMIRNMTQKADARIWGALLTACRKCGNIDVAGRVVEEILAMDPQNHGVYVVLSNMYAEAGQWEDVLRLRKVMKAEKLKKIPGWSLVDDGS